MDIISKYLVLISLYLLSGCSSFIAHVITNTSDINVTGNLSDFMDEFDICDSNKRCFKAYKTKTKISKMRLTSVNGNSKKVWLYSSIDLNTNEQKPLTNQSIYLFSGYSQPANILIMLQDWLAQVTGADVFIIPSANSAEQFEFGINYVEPLVTHISKRKQHVHLLGFSMGAIAAQQVAAQVDNATLHLIAPMSDFKTSIKLVLDSDYPNWQKYFISDERITEVANIVVEKSGIETSVINLFEAISSTNIKTSIYYSVDDQIVTDVKWESFQRVDLRSYRYEDLHHYEMLMLMSKELKTDLLTNLINAKYVQSNVDLLGVICEGSDDGCLSVYDDKGSE
ncbi:MAG: hypothetical protein VX100_21370 [Pseudomonadota bacterium]|nr:hypothetical protein [Pseudomonadota bacterium]